MKNQLSILSSVVFFGLFTVACASTQNPSPEVPTPVLTPDNQSSWFKGTWVGSTPTPGQGSGDDRYEFVLSDGGKFKGDIQSVRGGLVRFNGTYELEGDALTLHGRYTGGRAAIFNRGFQAQLTRNGKNLVGDMYLEVVGKTVPVTLTRTN